MSLINIQEAARITDCSDKTLRRAIEAGELVAQPRERANQPIMIVVEDLQTYMAARHGVQLEVTEVTPLPSKEKPSRSGTDTALVDRIAALERLVQDLQVDYRADAIEANVLPTKEAQTDEGLEARMDTLDKALASLSSGAKDLVVRIDQLEKDEARDIADLGQEISKVDARLSKRLDDQAELIADLRKTVVTIVEAVKQINSSINGQRAATPSKPHGTTVSAGKSSQEALQTPQTYEGEWTIVSDSGEVKYHGIDGSQARIRLDSLTTNYPQTKWKLNPPVFTPSQGTALEVTENLPDGIVKQLELSTGEVILFRHDLSRSLLPGYDCEARHKDVYARLAVQPYRQGERGTYMITQTHWGKVNPVGKEGPKQIKRAQFLLATLVDRAQSEMRRVGWTELERKDSSPVTLWRMAES